MESVSRKMILNKCLDILLSENANEMYKFAKPANRIIGLKLEWKENIKEQQKKGLSDKETANLKEESVKYSVLESLKNDQVPGPFTTATEVQEYFEIPIDDKIKNKRMYNEVRYARMIKMSLKSSTPVFRLKRNSRNLETREYVNNIWTVLEYAKVRHCPICRTLFMESLQNLGLFPLAINDSYIMGEHVAAFWYEGERFAWYLGVVDGFDETNQNILVFYLTPKDTSDHEWAFPEDADIHATSPGQILSSKIRVNYMCSVKIQCRIVSDELVSDINGKVRQLSQ